MSSSFSEISGYYDRLVDQFGHDPRACDYGHARSQTVKFKVLEDVTDYTGRSVLDVGCGFADFAGYVQERFERVEYHGLDLSPRMVAEATALRPHLDLRHGNLLELPPLEYFDIVTANGIFYLLGDEARQLMKELIHRMFEVARVAVAFNSLSCWAPDQEAGEFYADPLETVQFCRTLSPWVVLRHDYHPRDFTVYLYKERNVR